MNASGRVRQKAAQFINRAKDSDWETLDRRKTVARLCALFKVCCGERAWEVVCDRLSGAYCVSGADRVRKIRDRKQRTDNGKYSFVNRTIRNWNQLTAEKLGTFPCQPKIFRNRVRKAIINGVK